MLNPGLANMSRVQFIDDNKLASALIDLIISGLISISSILIVLRYFLSSIHFFF